MMRKGVLLLALIFLVSGCFFQMSISEIKYEPQKYRDREITIKGKVVETLGIPFVQKGIYQVDDGTGKIWVISQTRKPFRGEEVTVEGKVKTGFSIRGHTLGTVIAEGDEE